MSATTLVTAGRVGRRRLASRPVAGNAANDATSLPVYQALAEYLMGREPEWQARIACAYRRPRPHMK